MSEVLLPMVEDEWKKPAAATTWDTSVITLLGVVQGEILEALESHGPMSLYRLIQSQDRPASTVTMAVGALIREGLVGGNEPRLHAIAHVEPHPAH